MFTLYNVYFFLYFMTRDKNPLPTMCDCYLGINSCKCMCHVTHTKIHNNNNKIKIKQHQGKPKKC